MRLIYAYVYLLFNFFLNSYILLMGFMDLFCSCTKKVVAENPSEPAKKVAEVAVAVAEVERVVVEEKKSVSEQPVAVKEESVDAAVEQVKEKEKTPLDDMDEMTKTMFIEGRDLHFGLMKDIRAFIDKVNENYKVQIKTIDKLNKRKNDYVTGVCQFTMNMIYEINYLERFLDGLE